MYVSYIQTRVIQKTKILENRKDRFKSGRGTYVRMLSNQFMNRIYISKKPNHGYLRGTFYRNEMIEIKLKWHNDVFVYKKDRIFACFALNIIIMGL